jgi:maltose O-acetyltransferase
VAAVASAQWFLRSAAPVPTSVRLSGRVVVDNSGTLVIGERVQFESRTAPQELICEPGATLVVGEGTFINHGTSLRASESIRIGKQCRIGTFCLLADNDEYGLDPERRQDRPGSRPITLEDNVWLAARVVVLPGVTIGAGSVVAAGSVVTHDVPPRTLVAGVPARAIRSL